MYVYIKAPCPETDISQLFRPIRGVGWVLPDWALAAMFPSSSRQAITCVQWTGSNSLSVKLKAGKEEGL